MFFRKDEKVFSVSRTAKAVPHGDVKTLFSEFYCYLLICGFFAEGGTEVGTSWRGDELSSPKFGLPYGPYREGIGQIISAALMSRYELLMRHPDLSSEEIRIVECFNAIFTDDTKWYAPLSGQSILGVAYRRDFDPDMVAIAHYVAVAFGQAHYPPPASLPRLYISVFGNIHLAKEETMVVGEPHLRYGQLTTDGSRITALWSFISSQIGSLCKGSYPGEDLGDMLSSMTFLASDNHNCTTLPLPRYAAALRIIGMMGLDPQYKCPTAVTFYKDFLYGNLERQTTLHRVCLQYILDVMMEKVGETCLSHLFVPDSLYKRLSHTDRLPGERLKKPAILEYALEALSAGAADEEEDPSTSDVGYDPATPPPLSPIGTPSLEKDKNNIDLISFDKSGEGVNEGLYRAAVIALNDRLQSDDSVPVTADVKDRLDWWVNGYLYRTAISATEDQISSLGLQKYLKSVSTKG